tara:strand:+ start:374 stop:1411 length:1038 start_codon:yes stop_codon:yes gene_type:complete
MEFDEQFIEDIPQFGIGGFLNKTFKSVKKAVKKIAPIVGGGLGFMMGGAAGAGIGAGIGGLIAGQKADKALQTALMGYGIGSLAGAYGPLKGFAGKGLPGGKFAMGDDFNVIKGAQNMMSGFASNPDKVVKDPFIEFAKEKNMLDSSGNLLPNIDKAEAKKLFTQFQARGSSKLGAGDVFSKSNLLVGGGLGALSYLDAKKQAEDFEAGDPNALNPLYYNDPQEFQLAGQGVKPYYYTDMQDQFGVPIEELADDFVRTAAQGGIINLADGSKKYFPRKNGEIDGPGTGTSDDIPAMLSDGEFVFTAKAVNNAGGGNSREGAKRMYQVMKNLEKGGRLSEQSRGRA